MTARLWKVTLVFVMILAALCIGVSATDINADNMHMWELPEDFEFVYGEEENNPEEESEELEEEETEEEEDSLVFPDVRPIDWFYHDIMSLYEAGVVDGFPNGTYQPKSYVTTGQALKMIILAAGYEEPEEVASHWARGYLNFALEKEFLLRGEITDLDVNMSRGLVAKIAALALELERTNEEQHFSDTNGDYVHALYEAGIVDGYPDKSYQPKRSLTRAELATIVYRIYEFKEEQKRQEEIADVDFELRTTEDGIDLIKALEGFTEHPYWDYLQYSIGYGTRCERDDYPDGITKEEADLLLREKIHSIEEELDEFLEAYDIELDDHEYDAIVSFTYNNGSTWMKGGARSSRLAALLIDGDYTVNEFASAAGIWCHVTVSGETQINTSLIQRRIREIQLFLYGDYSGKDAEDFCYVIYTSEKGSIEVDVAVYEKGSTYDPLFSAEADDEEEDFFLGWWHEDYGQITEETEVEEDLTLVAVWESDYYDDEDDEWDWIEWE